VFNESDTHMKLKTFEVVIDGFSSADRNNGNKICPNVYVGMYRITR